MSATQAGAAVQSPTEGQATTATPAPTPAKAESAPVANQQQKPAAATTALTQEAPAKAEPQKDAATGTSPDKYEFKQPEGRSFDAEVLSTFGEVAKSLGLSQDKAQTIIDKLAPVMEQRQSDRLADERAAWVKSIKSDKEIGGDKFAESLAVAQKALKSFGSPELTKLLNDSGLGDHPDVIRFFHKVGKSISEDGMVQGRAAAEPVDSLLAMYPSMAKKK